MNFDPGFLAAARTDEELHERIENRQKYMPETIEASLAELQRRGKVFAAEELQYIDEDIAARRRNAATAINRMSLFNSDFKYTIVKDPDAPSLYSRRVIYVFTVLMSALFGSIMMAININKTDRKGVVPVILFGLAFTTVQIFIGERFIVGSRTFYSLFCGIISAYCLNYFFWNKYIGNTTFYRVKMAWGPLAVMLVIFAIVILLVCMYETRF